MEHDYFNLSGAAFWLFIAAAVVSGAWAKSRRETEKHETLRRIVEKTGTVDEAKLKDLFSAPPAGDWDWMKSKPGDGYRGLRVGGTVVMSLGAGIALCFLILGQTGVIPRSGSIVGLSIAAGVALLGAGLFFSSRFTEPPPDKVSDRAR